jgi:hypothetical protein
MLVTPLFIVAKWSRAPRSPRLVYALIAAMDDLLAKASAIRTVVSLSGDVAWLEEVIARPHLLDPSRARIAGDGVRRRRFKR